MNCKPILLTGFFLFFSVLNYTNAQWRSSSELSQGDIYKISIPESGIYKIDFSYLNNLSGLDINQIDPRKINLLGSPGGKVAQVLDNNLRDDLREIPIFIEGEGDGSFDNNDYILFYAEGADKIDLSDGDYNFIQNPYTNENFVFLKIGANDGLRVTEQSNVASPEQTSNSTESFQRHEQERINLLGNYSGAQGSGQEWYGESFAGETSQNFSQQFSFPNLIPGEEVEVKSRFASRSDNATQYSLEVNGNTQSAILSRTFTGDVESIYAHVKIIDEKWLITEDRLNVGVNYFPTTSQDRGWLDYIQITARERCTYNGQPLILHDRNSLNHVTYGFNISTSTPLTIWNVTDVNNVTSVSPSTNGNQSTFGYNTDQRLERFIAFEKNGSFAAPGVGRKVDNQNIHGIEKADFVIIYYNEFQSAAEKLKNHRVQHDGFTVEMVDVEKIYNEYGSGKADPSAIRNFAKMVKDRDANFKYLLLLGDASYDYRGLNPDLTFQNFIPTFETSESLDPIESFPTDDFFGLLEIGEGGGNLNGSMEIGIGRIPCKTSDEANAVVDKIINYDTNPETLGPWRMHLGFTADDEDGDLHIRQADGIARSTKEKYPELIQEKVYFDAFNQESTPGGARYPDARQQINANVFDGQLVLNYLGHGGPKGWADERVLQITDILNWNNYNKLPVFITATCSFTGFDEPSFVSAGEHVLLNPNGGAIALFTTVRAVFANDNERITKQVFNNLFTKTDGKAMRLGDVMIESQNALTGSDNRTNTNTRKFMLIGDPSQRLALPKHNVVLEKIDGVEVTDQSSDTISALQRVNLQGSIKDYQDGTLSSFNGKIFLTVFDKSSRVQVLDNDDNNSTFSFDVQRSVLYKGSASVTGGQFSIDFILPKDINFDFGPGQLSFYATDNVSEDAGGQYDNIVIGGTSENVITDNEGPEIEIFFDDRSFTYGGRVSKAPLLLLDLSDENGINLSGTSIGHDINAKIDDINDNGIVLNQFFEATPDEIGSGTVTYQMEQLEVGMHTIYVKAWDILNNSSEKMSEFFVADDEDGFIRNVFNYPNPFSTSTKFTFEHDLGRTNVDILINIYSMSGKLIKTIQNQRFGDNRRIDDINWDGRTDSGNRLAKGVYLYKIKLESNEFNLSRESDFHKLVILN